MNTMRFFAIFFIFSAVTIGWMALGGTLEYRTSELKDSLSSEVNEMWGPADLVQWAPWVQVDGLHQTGRSEPTMSDIAVHFEHEHRRKGLLWFSPYKASFSGTYELRGSEQGATFIFEMPDGVNMIDNLSVTLDGAERPEAYPSPNGNTVSVALPAGDASHQIAVSFTTQGRGSWKYSSSWRGQNGTAVLDNFTLTATTNFKDIDYPKDSKSPTTAAADYGDGMKAEWKYGKLRSTHFMGIEMPRRLDAGPVAARMSFFAPVSFFFFLTVLFTVVVLKKIPLHPMHYLFIAAGFFAFHILLAYLVDHRSIHQAFAICAAVSVVLVVSYMRLVAGVKFSVLYVGLAQLIYLIGFSYAFFWKGYTGLTVVIGAIVTLFVLMQATGRVDWAQIFKRPEREPFYRTPERGPALKAPPPPPVPPLDEGTARTSPDPRAE
jgi:hypothetical protein